MKSFRMRLFSLAAALVVVLGLSGAAMAAETKTPAAGTISVQLDGKNLTFEDAVPQVMNQRTFLPLRAVFEAMGAKVSSEGNVITAVRGDKTLTMTLGYTDAKLNQNGKDTTITMDVAPYVDNATWRTYVPVRFAAQAFGCAVGWDQKANTVVLVDVDTLANKAMADRHYTYLDKYMAYGKQFQKGNWDFSGKLDGTLTLMEMEPMVIAATYKCTTTGNTAVDMTMQMTMNMDAFLGADATPQDKELANLLKTKGITYTVRGDLSKGMLYMQLPKELLASSNLKEDTWIALDMNVLMKGMGMDFATLLTASQQMLNSEEGLMNLLLQTAASAINVNDSTSAYTSAKTAIDSMAKFFADESFTKNGNSYTNAYSLKEDNNQLALSFTLAMAKDAVTGFVINADLSTVDKTLGTIAFKVSETMDQNNKLTATIKMDMGQLISMSFNMNGAYTPTDRAPMTEPPAGATVIPFEALASRPAA